MRTKLALIDCVLFRLTFPQTIINKGYIVYL